VRASRPYERVLGRRELPGAEWFPGAELSYSEHVFAGRGDEDLAIVHASESRPQAAMTWRELRTLTAAIAGGLRDLPTCPRRLLRS
jgi:acetoacetyl-CoA synthetase